MNILPIAIDELVHGRAVESVRREFKKTWNDVIAESVVRTICAFANDFQNLNGGYVLLGIEEVNGLPVLPPHGLGGLDVDRIQRQIRGACERIDPKYQPVLSPEVFQGQQILVIWAPGGDVRPYSAPEHAKGASRTYYVRVGSETLEAKGEILNQLMQLAARVPYDDRRRLDVLLTEVSEALVRKFLADIRSDLVSPDVQFSLEDLLSALRLLVKTNGTQSVRNVALLFFTDSPEKYFPGARIEVVQFGDDAGGDLIEERVFRGPLPQQVRQVLEYLNNLSGSVIRKVSGQAEAVHFVAFPYEAMEEAIANAVLHRSYESPPEPVKVYLYPSRLEITSYPGPVPGLELKDLLPNARPPQAPMRNRRIGEFLKELRLAEMRGTGIPTIRRKMRENGSPEPQFEFDEARAYFRVTLPAHPEYVVLHALREGAQLWATGDRPRAIRRLEDARQASTSSGALAAQLIEYHAACGDLAKAKAVFEEAEAEPLLGGRHLPYMALARAYLDQQQVREAQTLLAKAPPAMAAREMLELAILHKRSGQLEQAHKLFERAYPELQNDAKAVHEFAQTKMLLAGKVRAGARTRETRNRLDREALELLHRVVQLADNPTRTAWAWFDIARTLAWLREPENEIRQACQRAMELLPDESRFREWLMEHDKRRSS